MPPKSKPRCGILFYSNAQFIYLDLNTKISLTCYEDGLRSKAEFFELDPLGRFLMKIKTKIRYLIIRRYLNFTS